MTRIPSVGVLALGVVLAGCGPIVMTYYEPSAPGATISSNWCGIAGAPPNLIDAFGILPDRWKDGSPLPFAPLT